LGPQREIKYVESKPIKN